MVCNNGMATMTHRTTFALDAATARRLRQLAKLWKVSQAEVVRRSVEEDVGLGIAWVRERSAGTPRLLHEGVRIAKRRGHRPGVTRQWLVIRIRHSSFPQEIPRATR